MSYCDMFTPFVSIIGFELSNIEPELLATHPDRVIRNSAVIRFFVIEMLLSNVNYNISIDCEEKMSFKLML